MAQTTQGPAPGATDGPGHRRWRHNHDVRPNSAMVRTAGRDARATRALVKRQPTGSHRLHGAGPAVRARQGNAPWTLNTSPGSRTYTVRRSCGATAAWATSARAVAHGHAEYASEPMPLAGLEPRSSGTSTKSAPVSSGRADPVRHGFRVLVADEVGVVVLCRCGRWGIATSTLERAEQVYSTEHLAEMGFRYARDHDD